MKEFRFEPSSQMIEVQEGQNLKIQITGYRTAYRSVESMENPMGCIGMCCAKCVSSSTPLFLQVWRRLSKSQFILIILCISTFFFAFFRGCGCIAKPRWQNYRRNHGYESIVWHWKWFVLPPERRGLFWYGRPVQISDFRILAFLALRVKKELLLMESRKLEFLKLCSELQQILMI